MDSGTGTMKLLQYDETTDKGHAFAARMDAIGHHRQHWPAFTKAKQDIALHLQTLCRAAYIESQVYVTARSKFITVKVEKPKLSAAWLYPTELQALRDYAEKNGIEPIATKTCLLFRVLK